MDKDFTKNIVKQFYEYLKDPEVEGLCILNGKGQVAYYNKEHLINFLREIFE